MNKGILIFVNCDFTFRLIKARLSYCRPDLYILRGTDPELKTALIDQVQIFYDGNDFSPEEVLRKTSGIKCEIRGVEELFSISDGAPVIDCRRILSLTGSTSPVKETSGQDKNKGRFVVFLPFSYRSEREKFISDEFAGLKTSDNMCLRLDLMSGIRMPDFLTDMSASQGCLTDILRLAAEDRLKKEDIPEHATYDSMGFLTLGKPLRSDDVFDYGIDCIEKVLKAVGELTKDTSFPLNILVVAEGFRFTELTKIASYADEVGLLVPKRLYKEDLGFRNEISGITRDLDPDIEVTVHCYEMTEGKAERHEAVRI